MIRLPEARLVIGGPSFCQEPHLGRAHSNAGAVLQRALLDAHALNKGPVGRAAIVEPADAGRIHADLRVLARGVTVLDDQVAAGLLADEEAVAQQVALAGAGATRGEERRNRAAIR